MTPQHFLSVIANMKTSSKHKYDADTDSESEVSENDEVVQGDQADTPTQQPANEVQPVQNPTGVEVISMRTLGLCSMCHTSTSSETPC